MEAVQTIESSVHHSTGPEEVCAVLREVGEMQKENARRMDETDRQMKETDRLMKETREQQKETNLQMQETDRQIKDFNRRFGDFTRRFGEVVEYMIAPNLCDKFNELGFDFHSAASGKRVRDYDNTIFFEIDVILENGDKAMLVEIKTKLTTEHVNDHKERMEKMRTYANLRGDKRTFFGAVAGVVMEPNVKDYALKQGFFVIEPSGESFSITPPESKPKEW